jgi:hypothetical protein
MCLLSAHEAAARDRRIEYVREAYLPNLVSVGVNVTVSIPFRDRGVRRVTHEYVPRKIEEGGSVAATASTDQSPYRRDTEPFRLIPSVQFILC